jgi:hypothetical protein
MYLILNLQERYGLLSIEFHETNAQQRYKPISYTDSSKSKNTCGKYGQKFIYASQRGMNFTATGEPCVILISVP